VLHLDEGELIEYKGTYTQYRIAGAADEERRSKLASRQDAEIQRLSTLADSMRGSSASAPASRRCSTIASSGSRPRRSRR